MSFYVRRSRASDGRPGWTGPIRSERQAGREAEAWQSVGWFAEVVPSTAEVRAQARAWQRAVEARQNRREP